MNLEIILSCMNQSNLDIVLKSKIESDVVIVNQCNLNNYYEDISSGKKIRMISTTERGLSRSRNLAIKNALGDICLVTDDDESFLPNYEKKIIDAFENIPEADVIVFQVERLDGSVKKYPSKQKKLSFLDCLKVSSIEIAFKRKSIIEKNIIFDETVGSGVTKAGGEENIFLHSCLRNNLSIYFVPETIVQLNNSASQWMNSIYSKEYFIDRGKFTKKLLYGKVFATIYAFYFALFKWKEYKYKTNMFVAIKCMLQGIFNNKS